MKHQVKSSTCTLYITVLSLFSETTSKKLTELEDVCTVLENDKKGLESEKESLVAEKDSLTETVKDLERIQDQVCKDLPHLHLLLA